MGAWIAGVGGYLPNLRIAKALVASEFAWTGLPAPRKGNRSVAGWDEDSLTMAVEASRALVDHSPPAAFRFASTTSYFMDRSQSAIAVDALSLPRTVRTSDAANARRSATTLLLDALLSSSDELIAAAEKHAVQPGNASLLSLGDGAAAVRTGPAGAAEMIGHASITHDFVDRYASRDHPVPYYYEERFVRDTIVQRMIVPSVKAACEKAAIDPADIKHAAVAEPVGGCWAAASKELGCRAPNHCEAVSDQAGDLGAAHALFGLALAFVSAGPGDIVLVVGLGGGADAILFRVDGNVSGAEDVARALGEGALLTSISRFLSLTGSIDLDWGMRSEFAQKAQATVLERVGRDMIGFIGGRDSLGNVQFPKSAIPVNPDLGSPEVLEDVPLAGEVARIVSITADRLNFTPDPPFDFGLVQFDNGARVMMEMTDRPEGGFAVGQDVRMRLRIKSLNRALGFRTYFWKATPLKRARLGDN